MASITLQQAKDWLRVDFDEDDDLISELIDMAQSWIEMYTCHCISKKTITINGNGKCKDIYLYPISNIEEGIEYVEFSLYTEFKTVYGQSFSIEVGYDDIEDVPKPLIIACKKLITFCYENRDTYTAELPTDVQVLINQYRRSVAWS